MRTSNLITAVSLTLVLAAPAQAEPLTMQQAVSRALDNNPGLRVAELSVEAARNNAEAADNAGGPVLTLATSARVSDDPLDAFADKLFTRQVTTADFAPARLNEPGYNDLWFTRLSLRWPLYTGGLVSGQQQQADAQQRQGELELERARQRTAFFTMQTYLSAHAAAEAVSIADDAVTAAQDHADTTTRLAEQGRIVESDKLAAEVNLAAVRVQREKVRTLVKTANNRLRLLMAEQGGTALELSSDWPNIDPVDGDLEVLAARALELRTDLAAAKQSELAAAASVDVADAANKPSVDLVASNSWYDDEPGFDEQSASLMAVASFSLYDGTTGKRVSAARAQHKAKQWQSTELEQKIRSEVEQARDELLEAEQRFAIAEDNVTLAHEATRQVKQRYGQGRTILLDLLQSEKMLTDARMTRLTAELDVRINRLALQYAVGSLAVSIDAGE